MGDLLLAIVPYSRFRSEHLSVHRRYVGTPRDSVAARYTERFRSFYPYVPKDCLVSAFRAEKAMLARRGRAWYHLSNQFFRYAALQFGMSVFAFPLGGREGLLLFPIQAGIAIRQLELVNYVEHYGIVMD